MLGLAYRLISELRESGAHYGIKNIELSWILEDNTGMRAIIEDIGGRVHKTYRIYSKHLRYAEIMNTSPPRFTAIVLGGDREAVNEVAKAAGVRCKSLAPVDGTPMVFRVLEALRSSRCVGERIPVRPARNRYGTGA